jgi:hypothetical protein
MQKSGEWRSGRDAARREGDFVAGGAPPRRGGRNWPDVAGTCDAGPLGVMCALHHYDHKAALRAAGAALREAPYGTRITWPRTSPPGLLMLCTLM